MNVKTCGTFLAVFSPGPLSAALRLSPPCASHCTSCTDCHPPHKTSNLLPRSESSSIPPLLSLLPTPKFYLCLVVIHIHVQILKCLHNTKIKNSLQ